MLRLELPVEDEDAEFKVVTLISAGNLQQEKEQSWHITMRVFYFYKNMYIWV